MHRSALESRFSRESPSVLSVAFIHIFIIINLPINNYIIIGLEKNILLIFVHHSYSHHSISSTTQCHDLFFITWRLIKQHTEILACDTKSFWHVLQPGHYNAPILTTFYTDMSLKTNDKDAVTAVLYNNKLNSSTSCLQC